MDMIDCHTHTSFSVDSDADLTEMFDKARKTGLKAYAVTDHCECNCWYPEEHYKVPAVSDDFDFARHFEDSVSAVTALKEKYEKSGESGEKTELLCGVEMGQATHDTDVADIIVNDARLDIVIASVHQIYGYPDFAFIDYSALTENEIYKLLEKYFEEVYTLCRWGKFDILGHLTYALRYLTGDYGIRIDMSRFDDMIGESFRALIENGCGIEINTSGLRQKYGDTFPSGKYIRLYKSLGGEIISVGSDAHTPEDIGKGIGKGIRTASAEGFKYISYFKRRKPVFIEIKP